MNLTLKFILFKNMYMEGSTVMKYSVVDHSLNKGETILLPSVVNQMTLKVEGTPRLLEVCY